MELPGEELLAQSQVIEELPGAELKVSLERTISAPLLRELKGKIELVQLNLQPGREQAQSIEINTEAAAPMYATSPPIQNMPTDEVAFFPIRTKPLQNKHCGARFYMHKTTWADGGTVSEVRTGITLKNINSSYLVMLRSECPNFPLSRQAPSKPATSASRSMSCPSRS